MGKFFWAEVRGSVLKELDVSDKAVFLQGRERGAVRIKRVMAWVGREVGGKI